MEPAEVDITFGVTGGFAGVDYAIAVDGEAREVRGVRCASVCDFVAGELLLPISAPQVAALARALDEAGVIELGERDFGVGCCDFYHVELTYRRGQRTVRLQGTEDRFPEAVANALRLLHPLASRTRPMIVALGTDAEDWPRDPYGLGDVEFDGSRLHAQVSYGGGCRAHRMDLVAWGGWMESFPVQLNALITHDDGGDPCDAIVRETLDFDLYPLARAYREAYGGGGGEPPVVILRLWDPGAGSARLIEVRP